MAFGRLEMNAINYLPSIELKMSSGVTGRYRINQENCFNGLQCAVTKNI